MKFPCIKMSQYFPNPFRSFEGNIHVKADLSNDTTKSDIKHLASLKTEFDKLDSQFLLIWVNCVMLLKMML